MSLTVDQRVGRTSDFRNGQLKRYRVASPHSVGAAALEAAALEVWNGEWKGTPTTPTDAHSNSIGYKKRTMPMDETEPNTRFSMNNMVENYQRSACATDGQPQPPEGYHEKTTSRITSYSDPIEDPTR